MTAPIPDHLQAALGSSYTLQRALGQGGMATVYLARDVKHQRLVALKVLHPDLALSLGPERFRREITTLAQLQHPHILSVHDSGETATGQLWFTMPYVEGESLRDRLRRERQLSVEDAVRITREVASALAYAHHHGIIHRDIKPENILLTEQGDALLADFGIARALAGGTNATGLTEAGLAMGTPQYMSPEQASGERDLTPRSDVYALAVVCYEMLAGEPPFTGPTPQATIAKMLASPPPSIRIVRTDVPVGVDAALRKALGTAPAARYGTAAEFGAALDVGLRTGALDARPRRTRRTAVIVAAALVTVGGAAATFVRAHGPAGPVMLAVLPFETEGDTADAWVTDGIADEVRGKLAGVSGVRVIARASSNQYRRSTKRPEDIGRELGVRYLLTGRIRWATGVGTGRRVRVDPELVQVADVRTPQVTWAQPFDEQQADVFKLQTDIAERVAAALQIALDPAERASIAQLPTHNPEAYFAYLRGEALERTGVPGDNLRARGQFRLAVTLDSAYADAWVALADNMIAWAGRHPFTPMLDDSARTAAEHALAIAPTLPKAKATLGMYYELIKLDTPRAYALYRAALDHAPSDTYLLAELARAEMRLGKWDSAVVHSERTVQLNPRNAYYHAALGNAYLLVRRYDDADRACAHARELSAINMLAVFCDIQVPLARGDLAAARSRVRSALPGVDSMVLYTFLASYGAYTWVLDSSQRRALLTLPQSAFDRGPSMWASARMLIYDQIGDSLATRAYADSAAAAFQVENHGAAADSDCDYGWALAYAGRRADAISAVDRYLALHPIDRDFLDGPDNAETVVKTYVRAGATGKALDLLERLLRIPGRLTPGRLRLDPSFTPLRGEPRFQRLIASPAAGERP